MKTIAIILLLLAGGCAMHPYTFEQCWQIKEGSFDYDKHTPRYLASLVEFCMWDESKSNYAINNCHYSWKPGEQCHGIN